ncbi:hypothetical protein [Micromonospora purpureochromogenes]|uniref:Uncharacterized protein n=1 Tax=Micromonospora purpureochromogenes TaxID=47872 RepID=A0ABX2RI03_9ACTN|nr:hypothetical protein [Micromonospora purpureochromogenes]NYF56137.1 hypothetical protein [Micromonospora purpureochromogenes]
MYAWIWRKLPFGLAGKIAGSLLLAVATVALLWYVVFPWAEPLVTPFDDVQVTQEDSGVPGNDGGGSGPVGDEPAGDEHDIQYDTDQNNTPPPSPNE